VLELTLGQVFRGAVECPRLFLAYQLLCAFALCEFLPLLISPVVLLRFLVLLVPLILLLFLGLLLPLQIAVLLLRLFLVGYSFLE